MKDPLILLFKCPKCGSLFGFTTEQARHIPRPIREQTYECDLCGYSGKLIDFGIKANQAGYERGCLLLLAFVPLGFELVKLVT